jgi:CRISPR-associated endonuclease Cas2
MRLPITDEFLWEVFNLSQKVEDVLRFIGIGHAKDAFVPPEFDIKRIYEKKKARMKFSVFINYLKKKGYIKIKGLEPNQGIIITDKGLKKILETAIQKTKKKKRKDGKFLMVIFDIPERKRKLRDLFRKNLQALGFKFYQKSIWISPFDVFNQLEAIIRSFNLEKYVKIFLIEEVAFKGQQFSRS